MSNRFFKIQTRWVFYGVVLIMVATGLALAQDPPQEFVELDQKLRSGGCALWATFVATVKTVLLFGAGYAAISYFIGNANSSIKAAIYVVAGGAVFVILIAVIRYLMGGTDPCTVTTSALGLQNLAQQAVGVLMGMA
ncbi:hypothetical protein [Oceanithermus sp.]|uniref:hypothetical protein n=1 Tax=Oceanithermus sp. TaxID=2268145 RepID=UPI00257BED1D|nr:hypothetical protein [Oceanithermus sp.]